MKKAYIQTFGCQMNEHDSGRMMNLLSKEGYAITEEVNSADLILLNTCSVRANPENKVYSQLGRFRELKKKNPNLIVGVGGCVAQQEGETILKREQSVDMVFGTDNFLKLPEMLSAVEGGERVLYTQWLPRERKIQNFIPDEELENNRLEGCKAFISITKGCDNFCAFCIVPTTRGREVSRELDNILFEVENVVKRGAKEICLLGQNVNSYKAHDVDFYRLLDEVSKVEGVERIRFTSPYPNDWNNELSDLMASNAKICNQLHLPFQAGSDRILKAMRRGHSIENYIQKMKYLKDKIPSIQFSTDIIVGFPTETEEDFEGTMKTIQEIDFYQCYAFKYSPRPGTKASKIDDDVPKEVKEERLARIIEHQKKVQQKILKEHIGSDQLVLIDSAHPKERETLNGKTEGGIAVAMPNSALNYEIGDLVSVKITKSRSHSLEGEIVQ